MNIQHNVYAMIQCLVLTLVVGSPIALAGTITTQKPEKPGATTQLDGKEILQAFADVRDDARVQDAQGTVAVNHWYADGRFISRWKNALDSGEVTGTWRVENDLRCITISAGLPQRIGKEKCGPVFRRGSQYLSFNADGSIHGIHKLSPIEQPLE